MATGFNLANMFRPTQQVTPAVPGPGNPPAPTGRPGETMQLNNPGAGGNPPADNQTQDNSPLAAFSKMWETVPADKQPTDPWSQPILPNDPAKIQTAAKSMNMLAGVPPELLQKVTAGNDPEALMQVLNAVAQNTLAMSAQLTTASVEKAGLTIRDRSNASLDDRFKDFMLRNTPVDNPVLNHPGAQGLLKLARSQLKMTNPDWSAQQINDAAVEYLTQFSGAMSNSVNPQDPSKGPDGTPKEQDFSSFLE